MCKWSDPFSKRVLIDRGLDHNSLETFKSTKKWSSSDYSVLKARPSKKHWTKYNRYVILVQSDRSVSMTVRFHLFPFRTQQLSSLVPKIVRWKRRVKIGSRRLTWNPWGRNSLGVCCFLHGTFFHRQRNCQKFLFLLDFFVQCAIIRLEMLLGETRSNAKNSWQRIGLLFDHHFSIM